MHMHHLFQMLVPLQKMSGAILPASPHPDLPELPPWVPLGHFPGQTGTLSGWAPMCVLPVGSGGRWALTEDEAEVGWWGLGACVRWGSTTAGWECHPVCGSPSAPGVPQSGSDLPLACPAPHPPAMGAILSPTSHLLLSLAKSQGRSQEPLHMADPAPHHPLRARTHLYNTVLPSSILAW